MRRILLFGISILIININLFSTTLEEIYNTSSPGLGYDKLLILEKGVVYTGGMYIYNENVGIRGNGAIIDLQGGYITVNGVSKFEMDGCIITNGSYALAIQGEADVLIKNSTFYGNDIAINYMSTFGIIEVYNTIISHSSQYGFVMHEESHSILHHNDVYANLQGDYMKWCPS